ncbi:MAG: peroxidase family protein [Pseudomonadota bacterium]
MLKPQSNLLRTRKKSKKSSYVAVCLIAVSLACSNNSVFANPEGEDHVVLSTKRPDAASYGGISAAEKLKPVRAGRHLERWYPADSAIESGELSGKERPGPRDISNIVSAQNGLVTRNSNGASDILWSWGQFIDHDIVLTREGTRVVNIDATGDEHRFSRTGSRRNHISYARSRTVKDRSGHRAQINDQTPAIDGSMVYGTSREQNLNLRRRGYGKMRLTRSGYLLRDSQHQVLAGDRRAAEQPGLLALHTLFVREHNRLAPDVYEADKSQTNDDVFAATSRLVIHRIQAITYNEFLPLLVGAERANPDNHDFGTEPLNGVIGNEFATAAFRLGHTLVSQQLPVKKADGSLELFPLNELFFKPEFTREHGVSAILAGQSEQTAQKVDPMVVDSLRNLLIGSPNVREKLDLVSLNIQRGRDHNLPSYNEMRVYAGLEPVENFDDPVFQDAFKAKLAEAYDDVDAIDTWVGGLSEKAAEASMLGETFTRIVARQFALLAHADPNFYKYTASPDELDVLENLTLADIVRANDPDVVIDDTMFIATDGISPTPTN